MLIERIELVGPRISLQPLAASHLPGLATAIRDGKLWELEVTLVPHPDDLGAFLADADSQFAAGRELAFAVIDLASQSVVGSTRFRNISAHDLRVEIGFTFYARSWQRTYVNTHAKYLMLRHAFETWGANRVELGTDVLNTASRAAIARIGAREEGILRSHMIMRGGRVRDSALSSMIRAEWPQAKQSLIRRMLAR
ncbi:MAG: GNAT family protein [Pseudomonadota bacterium]